MDAPGETFADRLRILIEEFDQNNVRAFSRRVGVVPTNLQNYLNGSVPGIDKAAAIADATDVALSWLVTGQGPRNQAKGAAQVALVEGFDENDDARDFTLVPRLEVSASAGHGLVAIAEEVTERLAFKTEWLRDMGLSPMSVALVTCRGNSQDPVIKDGALMLVDTRPDQHIRSGCFYIIVLDGDVLVKLVNRRIDGTIELKSINPDYPTEVVDAQQLDRLHIPGQVVWAGQKL